MKANPIRYSLNKSSLEPIRGKYTGRVIHKKTVYLDDITAEVHRRYPNAKPQEMDLAVRALSDVVRDKVYNDLCTVTTGNEVAFSPAISGSLSAMDAPLVPGENELYVNITVCDPMRKAIGLIAPSFAGSDAADVRIDSVEDCGMKKKGFIVGTREFVVTGSNISARMEGEGMTLVKPDGSLVSAMTVKDKDGCGQRIYAQLAQLVEPGAYVIMLTTRGYAPRDADAEPIDLKQRVTVISESGPVPPEPPAPGEPTITGAKTQGDEDDHVNVSGGTLEVTGENLETATAIELLNASGELWQTVNATYADGKLTAELEFEDRPSATGAVRVTTAGGSATHNVSYSSH